jgi:DNA-binding winged helix-turn-helix (wHTH) protein/Tol biopolymer transport system component
VAVPGLDGIVRFGVFDVNPASRELRKRGIRVRLTGQPFAILLMLLERPGEVVSREDMRRHLWPGDTFVDFEHGLNSAVKKLRTALGDSADHPTFIETLPRVGYRFIAPVHPTVDRPEPVASPPVPAPQPGPPPPSAAPSRWTRGLALAAIAVLFVLGVSAALVREPEAQVLDAVRLTQTSRIDLFGRIQTDGSRLFFIERHGHRWDLMQMPASGGPVEPFTLPFPSARIFAVSPDRSEMIVGSFTTRSGLLPVWIVPTVGGTPTRLGEISARDAVYRPDGREITFSTADGIYAVGRDGAHPRRIAAVAGRIEALSWSPEGRVLRFEWGDPVTDTSAIWEVDALGGKPRAVLPGWDAVPQECCGRWTVDGRYFVFIAHHGGAKHIWAIPEGRRFPYFSRYDPILVTLETVPVSMDQPLLASGDRLFVLGSNERTEYVRFDPTTHETTSLLRGTSAAWVSISPDWQAAVYVADGVLWRSRPDGSNRTEIAAAAYHPFAPQLSPNANYVAFQGTEADSRIPHAFIVSIDGGVPREIVSRDQASREPTWSPDGNAIAYAVAAGDGGATPGLYILDLKTHATTKVPGSEGYTKASWSPDGSLIAAIATDDTRLALFDRRSGQSTELAKGGVLGPAVWSADSRFIYFQDIVEEDEPVRRVSVGDGRIERVVDFRKWLEGGVQRCGFESLAPDGTLMVRLSRGDHDVYSLKLALR